MGNYYIGVPKEDYVIHSSGREWKHHRYIRKEQLPSGKWEYYYAEDDGRGNHPSVDSKHDYSSLSNYDKGKIDEARTRNAVNRDIDSRKIDYGKNSTKTKLGYAERDAYKKAKAAEKSSRDSTKSDGWIDRDVKRADDRTAYKQAAQANANQHLTEANEANKQYSKTALGKAERKATKAKRKARRTYNNAKKFLSNIIG